MQKRIKPEVSIWEDVSETATITALNGVYQMHQLSPPGGIAYLIANKKQGAQEPGNTQASNKNRTVINDHRLQKIVWVAQYPYF